MVYTATALEDWISQRYIKSRIQSASDISIERIAMIHNIFINFREMPARYDIHGRYKAIVLDARCSPEEQREQFFHELCHILRHVGHQTMMPAAFRELQEWDARHFTMYATMPYFMLVDYDFENPYLIHDLAFDFDVTEQLCQKRIEHIQRNIMTNSFMVAERNHYFF
ncbi:ImmA/IrrE family metallo-endopeptidase [Virgibacillus litoralis]|uniref:Zn-dependent peptidase ImmA (M78 family) n=1 Tax=Virgibacillus litoralis TaxID=578221 RepID=A0ABS4HH44_9BACI|nr:ImmA/IrrE family metallo-endopeptidase [Virgibacillus litoralis]MBP1950245.1 Zn-dependent peptidase ImmA (M78 family) [Virgibacillus litoralis]